MPYIAIQYSLKYCKETVASDCMMQETLPGNNPYFLSLAAAVAGTYRRRRGGRQVRSGANKVSKGGKGVL